MSHHYLHSDFILNQIFWLFVKLQQKQIYFIKKHPPIIFCELFCMQLNIIQNISTIASCIYCAIFFCILCMLQQFSHFGHSSQNPQCLTDQQCLTPNRTMGQCINIIECDPLIEVLVDPQRTPEQTRYLQQSQCGTVASGVLVSFLIITICVKFNEAVQSLPSLR